MIEIQEGRFGLGIHAARLIEPGELILQGWGKEGTRRTRHTIQFDRGLHVDIRGEIQLINHSCDPNCGFLIRKDVKRLQVHALRSIAWGEELTVDYASFEDEIIYLGPCECGSEICRGVVDGYRGLPEDRRKALGPFVADYLVGEPCEAALSA